MSTQLIAHLKKKCEADDNVKILLSQWEFDQKLVGKALENIGGFYPHFSNHNASHSQQILVNIERILGKDIELLSGTDTWLILEAAYWHDIGMLVDAKSAKEVHGNEDFKFMVKTIAQDKSHDLHAFCSAYKDDDWIAAIGSEEHPFDGVEKYRQLIAEWFRRNHDKRIGGLIEDPFKYLNITSPRTELLPKRIYRYLGQICMSHGMRFTDVMEKLPFKQTGLGNEDCHPRFIGCLLRLGDLFDLDDNRFCPVMAKHVSQQPSMSKAHEDKHLSLREFQLDRRTVKLVAECPDEMSYIETQNWFGWIREEFQNQMSQWNLIVPNHKFGSLPTIEQLDVRMEIKYEGEIKKEKILLNNEPMKFTIDEKNGMELLQGANLYSNDLSIYRELIQNAIDATMLRIWVEEDQELLKTLNPYHDEFKKILNKYPINIKIDKKYEIKDSLDSIWTLSIQDEGLGISRLDLSYMRSMAGSSYNREKKKIIDKMPIWMKPSGEFGIGLHSAFLLLKDLPEEEDKITFNSINYFHGENLQIDMYSPLGEKKGYCFITKYFHDFEKKKIGTKISVSLRFKYLDKINLTDFNGSENCWNKNVLQKLWAKMYIDGLNLSFKNNPFLSRNTIEDQKVWDPIKNIAFRFKFTTRNSFIYAKFKGQNVEFPDKYMVKNEFIGVDCYIDCYGFKAKDVLKINRDYWSDDFIKIIKKDLSLYLNEYVSRYDNSETSMIKLILSDYMDKFKSDSPCDKWLNFKMYFCGLENSIQNIKDKEEFYFSKNFHVTNKKGKNRTLQGKVERLEDNSNFEDILTSIVEHLSKVGVYYYKGVDKEDKTNKVWALVVDKKTIDKHAGISWELVNNSQYRKGLVFKINEISEISSLKSYICNFISGKGKNYNYFWRMNLNKFPKRVVSEKYYDLVVDDYLINPYQMKTKSKVVDDYECVDDFFITSPNYNLRNIDDLSNLVFYYNKNEKEYEYYLKKYKEFLEDLDKVIDLNGWRKYFIK